MFGRENIGCVVASGVFLVVSFGAGYLYGIRTVSVSTVDKVSTD